MRRIFSALERTRFTHTQATVLKYRKKKIVQLSTLTNQALENHFLKSKYLNGTGRKILARIPPLSGRKIDFVDSKQSEKTALNDLIEITKIIKQHHKNPGKILVTCFKRFLFLSSNSLEPNSKRAWIAYCLDLSTALNAFSLMILLLSKQWAFSDTGICSDADADEESVENVDDVRADVQEMIDNCEQADEEHSDLASNTEDSIILNKVFGALETILTDEKNILMGLQLFQFLSLFLLNKSKSKKYKF